MAEIGPLSIHYLSETVFFFFFSNLCFSETLQNIIVTLLHSRSHRIMSPQPKVGDILFLVRDIVFGADPVGVGVRVRVASF